MKVLLAATTAIALVGGAAFAEITVSGDAKLGLDYNSEPGDNNSKHSFTHEMGVDFSGSGTTDGGLSFGGSAGFDTGDETVNTGAVFVSGAFGKITIGDNDPADLLAGGIDDVGLNGVGVDNVVEDIRGATAAQFRYDQSVGSIVLALSAGTRTAAAPEHNEATGDVTIEVKKNSYAAGISFSASGATVGLGYDSEETISAGIGYSTGEISANAFYARKDVTVPHIGSLFGQGDSGTFDAGYAGLGIDVSYTMDASTLTLVYAKTDLSNIQPLWRGSAADGSLSFISASFKGMGIGFSHDLGGGASLVAGFGQVPQTVVGDLSGNQLGQVGGINARTDLSGDKNVANVGLSFSF